MAAPLASSGSAPQNEIPGGAQNTYFHQQRALLVNEIAAALDTTLTHLNRLNRSLESVIGIGNEFSNVEALWSQFEGVMGNTPNTAQGKSKEEGEEVNEEEKVEESGSKLDTPPVARGVFAGRGS